MYSSLLHSALLATLPALLMQRKCTAPLQSVDNKQVEIFKLCKASTPALLADYAALGLRLFSWGWLQVTGRHGCQPADPVQIV